MKERIALLYSFSPHFLRALESLRREHPESHLTVIVPPSFPRNLVAEQADSIVELAPGSEQRRSWRHGVKLLRFLRKEKFGLFFVLFNSPALVLISVLSRSRERGYISPNGKKHPLSLSFLRLFTSLLARRIKGLYTYYRIWWYIRRHPILKEDKSTGTDKSGADAKDSQERTL